MNGGYVLYTIGDLFNDYMHILSKRVGKGLTARSYRKYEIARDKFYQKKRWRRYAPQTSTIVLR